MRMNPTVICAVALLSLTARCACAWNCTDPGHGGLLNITHDQNQCRQTRVEENSVIGFECKKASTAEGSLQLCIDFPHNRSMTDFLRWSSQQHHLNKLEITDTSDGYTSTILNVRVVQESTLNDTDRETDVAYVALVPNGSIVYCINVINVMNNHNCGSHDSMVISPVQFIIENIFTHQTATSTAVCPTVSPTSVEQTVTVTSYVHSPAPCSSSNVPSDVSSPTPVPSPPHSTTAPTNTWNVVLTPNDIEVDAGTQVVCTCHNDVTTEPPTREINDISYLACDLPFGYKANAVNLTFVAYENSTIRCGYLVYNDGTFFFTYSEISIVTVHPKGSVPPPDKKCPCDPELVAVDISDQDILLTMITEESCPMYFTVKDSCFPDTCIADKPCEFSKEVNQLLTVSLKDQLQYEHTSSFLPSAMTLAIDTSPSNDKCLSEIEMSVKCKTEIVNQNTSTMSTTMFSFNHLGCEYNTFFCLNSSGMSKCFKHDQLNDIPSLRVSRKGDYYIVDIDVDSLQITTIITAMCGAAEKSCDDTHEQAIQRLLYSFKLTTNAAAPPHYKNRMLKVLLFMTFFGLQLFDLFLI